MSIKLLYSDFRHARERKMALKEQHMPVSGNKTCFQAVIIVLLMLRSLRIIDFQCCCIQENSGAIKRAESMD